MELHTTDALGPDSNSDQLRADRTTLGAALLVGAAAFAFRILSLRGLPNDHYMHLAWAQQLLFSEVPGRDFVDPGMPLLYVMSALMQSLWAGPFGEALLTAGMLAVAAAATVVLVAPLANLPVGIAAALFQVALVPRLYSYPKILVPAVALLLLQRYATAPGGVRLAQLSMFAGLAVLLRRDLGLMAALAGTAGLAALFASEPRRLAAVLSRYIAGILLTLLPYVLFVVWTEGLFANLRGSVEFAKSDAHQFLTVLPPFTFMGSDDGFRWSWTSADAATLLAYIAYGIVGLAAVTLCVSRQSRDHRPAWATMVAGTLLLSLYAVTILRHPVLARLPDMASILSIVGAWLWWTLLSGARRVLPARPMRAPVALGAGAAATIVVTLITASTWTLGGLQEKIRDTGVFGGPRNVSAHVRSLVQAGSRWPWPRFWPAGSLPTVVTYLDACTVPSDRVLLTWSAPEYYFFARRAFTAGHALFLTSGFRTTRDQDLMLERLAKHRVPIVLVNEDTRAEFTAAYPLLDEYLHTAYRAAGRFQAHDGATITIAVHRRLEAGSTFGPNGWPCAFVDPGAEPTVPSWASLSGYRPEVSSP